VTAALAPAARVPKERPILFSAAMVRALLAGTKTQTRRVLTVPWRGSKRALPFEPYWVDTDGRLFFCDEYGDYHDVEKTHVSPYGEPGDRLWVKETWARRLDEDDVTPAKLDGQWAWYWADPQTCNTGCAGAAGKRRPSIFMPRWASRITLEIADVRVQRIADISLDDCRAEGVGNRESFIALWQSINGDRLGAAWSDSPWVWCLTFKRITP
jgi:hypothetical protein